MIVIMILYDISEHYVHVHVCSHCILTILSMCCSFIIMCLGKYFPTPEVDVVPETNQNHGAIPQGTIIIN